MRTRKKWLWLVFGIGIIVAGAFVWSLATRRPPIILTLPTGDQYRFVGITYGTNSVPPLLSAKLLNLLPVRLTKSINNKFGFNVSVFKSGSPTAGPMFRFWFKRIKPANGTSFPPPRYGMLLADKSGNLAGFWNIPVFPTNSPWAMIPVNALPRRSPEINCQIYPLIGASRMANPLAQVTVPNPFYGHFPQWTPEPVPAVKHDGDLEVVLDDVYISHPPANPIAEVTCNLSVRSSTNAEWGLYSLELSDVTSNKIQRTMPGMMVSGRASSQAMAESSREMNPSFTGTLWPDEAAWRLKITFKRSAGFDSNELVTLTNIPIPATGASNTLSVTNDGRVMKVVFSRSSVATGFVSVGGGRGGRNISVVQAEWRGVQVDCSVDCVSEETVAGAVGFFGGSRTGSTIDVVLQPPPTNAQTMTRTFVIQKTRTVEFLVKPPKPN